MLVAGSSEAGTAVHARDLRNELAMIQHPDRVLTMGQGDQHHNGAVATGTAHAFWVDPEQLRPGQAEEVRSLLPSHAVLGLHSQLLRFKSVVLWTYGVVTNAPPGVTQRRADDYLTCEDAARILTTHGQGRVAQLADVVRLLAVIDSGGWVVDCDNVWLRPPPCTDDFCFAAWPAKRSSTAAKGWAH